jgi:hypothetical protein
VEVREVKPLNTFYNSVNGFTSKQPSEWYNDGKPSLSSLMKFTGEIIHTLEGDHIAICERDLIIRGVNGELYPIKKDIFEKTYEWVEE